MARKRPAPYVPLSVYYADDEGVMDAGEDAELMYIRMLAYAGRTPTTEGYVPRRVCLTRLGIAPRPEVGPETYPEKRLERLTESGLIAPEGDGYRIVSWLKWNRSSEEMGRERAQDRRRKASLTRHDPETGPETAPETGPEGDADSSLFPEGRSSTEAVQEKTTRPASANRGPDRFQEFWDAFAFKNGRKKAEENWRKAIKRADPQVIIDGALAYAAFVAAEQKRRPDFTQKWAEGWLTDNRWEDVLEQPRLRAVSGESKAWYE